MIFRSVVHTSQTLTMRRKDCKPLLESLLFPGKNNQGYDDPESLCKPRVQSTKRSSDAVFASFVLLILSSWTLYYVQYKSLPAPLTAEQALEVGFSEVEARKHVQALDALGPHSVGSYALHHAIEYVKTIAETVKNSTRGEVDVELEHFHVKSGVSNLNSGRFIGNTLIYADLDHVLMKLSPRDKARNAIKAEENAILVSAHIDTVFSTNGAGDDTSNIAVMLELAKGISQKSHNFINSIIFFFNTGEEEGLLGAHSFITQHPWREIIRLAVDLESMGIGGKSGIFETGPRSFGIENFAKVARYPSGHIISQDLFSSGAVNSATDFQVYRDIGGLSGLAFAFTDQTAVYHTKNDKFELLKPGSLQQHGENMMAFLLQVASSSHLPNNTTIHGEENLSDEEDESSIYFDVLGMYMIVYRKTFGKMVNNSIISLSLLILSMSLYKGGTPATVSFVLSSTTIVFMWILSLSSSLLVAFILSNISTSVVPYIKYPWLVIGLFGSPSLLGALAGQHIGFRILEVYLSTVFPVDKQDASFTKIEAEKWLYKSGIVGWFGLLIVSNHLNIGSSYIALLWFVTPTLAYCIMEATIFSTQSLKPLKIATLWVGLSIPILVSVGPTISIIGLTIGTTIRLDSNPGNASVWTVNSLVAGFVTTVVCLVLVHLLSYVHLSGAGRSISVVACILFGLSLSAVLFDLVPTYTEDFARPLQVVHVFDTTGQNPISYISVSSLAPGDLTKEIDHIDEGFVCGSNTTFDFVTFSVSYGCWAYDDDENDWSERDIPTLQVKCDLKMEKRVTKISLDTKSSTRWSLAINTQEIEDFELNAGDDELIRLGNKISVDGWHIVRFAGGNESPTKFTLNLHWLGNSSRESQQPLLKLRTDVVKFTPKVEKILKKLPSWCSLFGKSASPLNVAFLVNLPLDF